MQVLVLGGTRFLGRAIVEGCHRGLGGVFNVTGRPMRFGDLLGQCHAVTGSDAEFAWVPTDRLLAAGVDPWMGVPL